MRDDTAREKLCRRTQLEECESRLLSTVQSLADFHVEDLTRRSKQHPRTLAITTSRGSPPFAPHLA